MPGKVITVFGATGLQGGSVVRALIGGGHYKVRAVTRSPNSESAKALVNQGAEVVKADLDDKASVLSSLTGAYGCFGVTDFWTHMDANQEVKQGKDLADACKQAGVEHYVYSGLENVHELIGLTTGHFDAKGIVEDYVKKVGTPYTIVRVAAYFENFLRDLPAEKTGDNLYGIFMPMGDKPVHIIPAKEIGECVQQIFLQKEKFLGKTVGLSSDNLTVKEMANVMSEELNTTVTDGKMSPDEFSKLGFPGAEDLANMFTFYQSGKYIRDINLTKKLNPKISTFRVWVQNNKDALLSSMNP